MLAPSTLATATWPIAGDVPDLLAIVIEQADTVAAQEALLHAYQLDLNAVVSPPAGAAATGTGSSSGTPATSLAVTAVTGTIVAGSTVTGGSAVPAGTAVLGQISGTAGGAGTYLTSQATTASATALTFTPPAGVSSWPVPRDAGTLNLITQNQTAVLRTQNALLQHYQDLLNNSQVAPPATGP